MMLTLEDDAIQAISGAGRGWSRSKVEIMADALGITSSPPASPSETAKRLGVGRPAASHALSAARQSLASCNPELVARAVRVARSALPTDTETLSSSLLAAGISNGSLGVEGLVELACGVGNLELAQRSGLLWPNDSRAAERGLRGECRSVCRSQGAGSVGGVASSTETPEVASTAESVRRFLRRESWAEFIDDEWFWDKEASPKRNRMFNIINKLTDSSRGGPGNLDELVQVLQAQVASGRVGSPLPQHVLRFLLERHLGAGTTTSEAGGSPSAEDAIVDVLTRRPGVSRRIVQRALGPLRIPPDTVDYWLTYSPVIAVNSGRYTPATGTKTGEYFLSTTALMPSGVIVGASSAVDWHGRLRLDETASELLEGVMFDAPLDVSSQRRVWIAKGELYGISPEEGSSGFGALEFDLMTMKCNARLADKS